jgi:hypothetical protein
LAHLSFFALDRPSARFSGDTSFDVSHARSYVDRDHFPNRYLPGLWELNLILDDSHGTLLRVLDLAQTDSADFGRTRRRMRR